MVSLVDGIDEVLRERRALIDEEREKLENDIHETQELENIRQHVLDCESQLEEARRENEYLASQLEKERNHTRQLTDEIATLNMRLNELSKMSGKVVEKTEHDVLLKIIRKYMNTSKKKSAHKRGYIKMVIHEMASLAKLVIPDDLAAALAIFDDETEPISTTVEAQPGAVVQISDAGINNQLTNAV